MKKVSTRCFLKKSNRFLSFKFDDFQFLDNMIFLDGATSLHSFLKIDKTSEMKSFFPNEWFNYSDKMKNTAHPSYGAFFSKLGNWNVLEIDSPNMLLFRKVEWFQSKPVSYLNHLNHHQLG